MSLFQDMEDDQEAFNAAVLRLQSKGNFTWTASYGDLVALIGQVQLALRHPANTGPSAARMRTILNEWIRSIRVNDREPRLAELLSRGFDPAWDVERKSP